MTGLYLAGLWLRGREDPGDFIALLEAGHRHIVDYLGAEVLARQPEVLKRFLLRTSILEGLSGSLCDALLESTDSAEVLVELERPTCSWSHWMSTAAGIVTITCSRSCCAWR